MKVGRDTGYRGGRRASLSCSQRLRDPRDFERVYAARTLVHAPGLVVFVRPNGLSFARLGVSVGRKHGNAVRRNRIKRVLRAAFRLTRPLLPAGNDYVLVPKQGAAACTAAAACASLERVARKLAERAPRQGRQSGG